MPAIELTSGAAGGRPARRRRSRSSSTSLVRLSAATGRHEDLLALLDVAARAGAPLAEPAGRDASTRGDLRRAVEGSGARLPRVRAAAVARSHRRAALADARRLAAAKGLWRPLDALYAELGDRAATVEQRVELARARHAIRAEQLKDPTGALDQLLVIYRLAPEQRRARRSTVRRRRRAEGVGPRAAGRRGARAQRRRRRVARRAGAHRGAARGEARRPRARLRAVRRGVRAASRRGPS